MSFLVYQPHTPFNFPSSNSLQRPSHASISNSFTITGCSTKGRNHGTLPPSSTTSPLSTNPPNPQSLRIVPTTSHPTQTHSGPGAPSAPGVHDTLRANLSLSTPAPKTTTTTAQQQSSTTPSVQSFHPLESRLAQWRQQQESLKMDLLRRQFGIAEPVRRQMELSVVRAGEWRPAMAGGGGNVHADILAGRDAEIGWEDVFTGEEMRDQVDFHVEMEGRFGMGW